MAVIKIKNSEGNFVAVPYEGGLSPTWSNLKNKPFTSIDSNTLEITDGVLTVIGGSGEEMESNDLDAAWAEVFGEE